MENVGSFEAKTHLPQLLERDAATTPQPDVKQVIEELKAFSKGNTLGKGLTIRGMIEDGRRF